MSHCYIVSKLFRAYGLYNKLNNIKDDVIEEVSKLFRAYGLYNQSSLRPDLRGVMFQSSFELTGYITENYVKYS